MRRGALSIALVLILAACGGGSPTLAGSHMSRFVLQPRDLGRPFSAFANGPQAGIDNNGTLRADPTRFGREGGWIARYHRSGTAASTGALVVESRVDLFKSDSGAKSDFEQYRAMLTEQAGVEPHPVDVPAIGDGAFATTFTQAGARTVRFYRIAWRYRNATASITAEGWDGKLSRSEAVALAQKQQARLRHG
jgi:hypothetical protein